MPSNYPNTLDSFATNRVDGTLSATTHALDHDNANDAINKIEAELGLNPRGSYATVAARLTALAAANVGIPLSTVTTAGDLIVGTGNAVVSRLPIGAAGTVPVSTGSTFSFSSSLDATARHQVKKAGTIVGTRRAVNIIDGTNITTSIVDDAANEQVNVTITAATGSGGAGGHTVYVYDPIVDYGAIGDGVADDTTPFQAAINAAQAAGVAGLVSSRAGKTFLISATVNITGSMALDLNGSMIKKKSTMAASAILITGGTAASPVKIKATTVEGNRAAGATGAGIEHRGYAKVYDTIIQNCAAHGWKQDTGSSTTYAELYNVESNDNSNASQNGFNIGSGKVLMYGPCRAARNGDVGVNIGSSAQDGCYVDVETTRNTVGVLLSSNSGFSTYIRCYDDNSFGLKMKNTGTDQQYARSWRFGSVIADYLGGTALISQGTGIEMYGACRNHFDTMYADKCNGYAVALTGGSTNPTTAPSKFNSFGGIHGDSTGNTVDSDPGVHLSRGCTQNQFGQIYVRKYTFALRIGEDVNLTPFTNDYNTFGLVTGVECQYGGLCMEGGSHNQFQSLHFIHCGTAEGGCPRNNGVVSFKPYHAANCAQGASDLAMGPTDYNVIQYLKHYNPSADGFVRPLYVVSIMNAAGPTVTGNRVLQGYYVDATSYRGAQATNPATPANGNVFTLATG